MALFLSLLLGDFHVEAWQVGWTGRRLIEVGRVTCHVGTAEGDGRAASTQMHLLNLRRVGCLPVVTERVCSGAGHIPQVSQAVNPPVGKEQGGSSSSRGAAAAWHKSTLFCAVAAPAACSARHDAPPGAGTAEQKKKSWSVSFSSSNVRRVMQRRIPLELPRKEEKNRKAEFRTFYGKEKGRAFYAVKFCLLRRYGGPQDAPGSRVMPESTRQRDTQRLEKRNTTQVPHVYQIAPCSVCNNFETRELGSGVILRCFPWTSSGQNPRDGGRLTTVGRLLLT